MKIEHVDIATEYVTRTPVKVRLSTNDLFDHVSNVLRQEYEIPQDGFWKNGQILVNDPHYHESITESVAIANPTDRQREVMNVLAKLELLFKDVV